MPLDNMQMEEIRRLLQKKKQDLTEATDKKPEKAPVKKAAAKKGAKKAAAKTVKKKPNPVQAAISGELREVDAALKRLKEQESRFGYCEHCFMEIPWRELAVNPARRFCSRCV
ncbi:MAG TPA: hypothetical protein DCM87_06355 [Planctomycetes bacterium]|nr:hypothetical protein [Planctomycetota bacterium]